MAQIGKSVGRTNEITTVSTIKPGLTLPLRVFLDASAGRLLHKVLENIEAIHYACWLIVPMNGRDYLVFISNYTGSFEKYIDVAHPRYPSPPRIRIRMLAPCRRLSYPLVRVVVAWRFGSSPELPGSMTT